MESNDLTSPKPTGFLAAFLLMCMLATTVPALHNWDMIAYVALANKWVLNEAGDDEVHRRTWSQLRAGVSAPQYASLRGDVDGLDVGDLSANAINYRQAVAGDPGALMAQLPFYSVKPLYPALIAVLSVFGVDPVLASTAIAKTCWVLLGCMLFGLLRRTVTTLPSLGLLGLFMCLPMVRSLGGYSTPDALCSLLTLSIFYLGTGPLTNRRRKLMLSAGVLAITARPDNILLLTPIALWLLARDPFRRRDLLGALALGIVTFGLQSHYSGNYGWSVLFYHSFVGYLPYPGLQAIDLQLGDILAVYWAQVQHTRQFWGFLGLAGLIAYMRMRWLGRQDHWFCGLLVIIVFMFSHWWLFPDQKDRMLVAGYLFVFAACVRFVADWHKVGGWQFSVSQRNKYAQYRIAKGAGRGGESHGEI